MAALLTSVKSARVSEVRKLQHRRHRVDRGAFVAEGPQAVREAVHSRRLRELYCTSAGMAEYPEIISGATECGAQVVEVTAAVMAAMCETENPQGLLAVCDLVTLEVSDLLLVAKADLAPRIVILDRLSDPGNVGTIIRTAAALGVQGVILTSGSVDPHNGKCVRASAGSMFHMPLASDVEAVHLGEQVQAAGFLIATTEVSGSTILSGEAMAEFASRPLAWVFGNEAHGVDSWWHDAADLHVRIPITDRAESLNVASAAAICIYETRVS